MQCPKCQIENPSNRKFCCECGAKLILICPKCQFENIPSDKFCGDCGHDLTQPFAAPLKELSFDEKIAKIQKYLPSGITEKILSQRDRIEGEKRQVTVMFCDMTGFTPLSEKLGPEAMYAMMDEVYEILIHKVHEYEGTVNEMTGDGVMALFGAPIALEDAPQRAIRSAMAIHREMTRFNERMRQEKGEFACHYGTVVIPARRLKPKDKAKVEAAVKIAEMWILAALRNHTFFSLEELNKAIMEKLVEFNNRKFQKVDATRRSLYETIDRPALKLLPPVPYQYAECKKVRVNTEMSLPVSRRGWNFSISLLQRNVCNEMLAFLPRYV